MQTKRFKSILFSCIAAIAICVTASLAFVPDECARAKDLYSVLTPQIIEIYEREIAGEAILSNISEAQLKKAAERVGVSLQKYRALCIVQDLGARVGESYTVGELAKMKELKLLITAKAIADAYFNTLSEQRQAELKEMLKQALAA